MAEDFFTIRERLRRMYIAPAAKLEKARAEVLSDGGFLTEIDGRVILTAPASRVTASQDLPKELAERWEKAAEGNPFMTWLQGRYVEAEKANRNGAFWSTEDLQFGEMSVKHGPLNWLHEEQTVIGTIADNAIIHPEAQSVLPNVASLASAGFSYDPKTFTYTNATTNTFFRAEDLLRQEAGLLQNAMPRPYMAAVSAVWKWVHPDKAKAIEAAAEQGRLYYSMECIAREMTCASDETHQGCGQSFDYITAMTQPHKTCEHIQSRASARRLVDPSFLGGAVIVPPTQPGWGAANVELVRASAKLAEETEAAANRDMSPTQWEGVMAGVLRFAGV